MINRYLCLCFPLLCYLVELIPYCMRFGSTHLYGNWRCSCQLVSLSYDVSFQLQSKVRFCNLKVRLEVFCLTTETQAMATIWWYYKKNMCDLARFGFQFNIKTESHCYFCYDGSLHGLWFSLYEIGKTGM
jgi:hypothetical protein